MLNGKAIMKTFSWTVASLLALALSVQLSTQLPAWAQYDGYTNPYTGRTFNNPMSSFLDTVIQNNMQTQMLMTSQMVARNALTEALRRNGNARRMSKRERQVADRFAKYRGTMFTAGKPVMPARLAAMFLKTPGKQRQDMTALFTELLKVYDARSKQQSAPPNDLARTLAYCIAVNYAYRTEQEVSAAGLVTLRSKIRGALSGDAKFRALSNAKKQELSETIIIMTHFAALGYDHAKEAKNEAAKQQFRQLAGVNLRGMLGVDPQRVKLEKAGLVIY
jgi:hypothetical protein